MVDSILIGDRKTRYYGGIMMSMDEWDAVDLLCKVLEVSHQVFIFSSSWILVDVLL